MNGFGAEWCGNIFILCNATLKMVLLLYKTALSPKFWSQTAFSDCCFMNINETGITQFYAYCVYKAGAVQIRLNMIDEVNSTIDSFSEFNAYSS